MNPRLRMVLFKCRGANMPNENIERAIKKGTGGGETTNFEDLTYEVYGPNGVALLFERRVPCRPDVGELRHLFPPQSRRAAARSPPRRSARSSPISPISFRRTGWTRG